MRSRPIGRSRRGGSHHHLWGHTVYGSHIVCQRPIVRGNVHAFVWFAHGDAAEGSADWNAGRRPPLIMHAFEGENVVVFDPLLAFLRRLPMVGRFVPCPQRPYWDMLTVYRIQISRPPVNVFAGEDAVLLDAGFAG